eukprot:1650715-Alexandrium_andersonii.AAC.1
MAGPHFVAPVGGSSATGPEAPSAIRQGCASSPLAFTICLAVVVRGASVIARDGFPFALALDFRHRVC